MRGFRLSAPAIALAMIAGCGHGVGETGGLTAFEASEPPQLSGPERARIQCQNTNCNPREFIELVCAYTPLRESVDGSYRVSGTMHRNFLGMEHTRWVENAKTIDNRGEIELTFELLPAEDAGAYWRRGLSGKQIQTHRGRHAWEEVLLNWELTVEGDNVPFRCHLERRG